MSGVRSQQSGDGIGVYRRDTEDAEEERERCGVHHKGAKEGGEDSETGDRDGIERRGARTKKMG
jgi:hypothetical protein